MFPMESSVSHGPSSQLHEQPPSKKQRFEYPTSSAFNSYSSYYDGTSTWGGSESAAAHVGESSSRLAFALGTCDDRGTTSHASAPSSASGNSCRTFSYRSEATPPRNNQSGEAANAHACSQASQVTASQDSVVNSATYSPDYGECSSEETYSFPVQSSNSSSGDTSRFPFPRVVHFTEAGSEREVDASASNQVSVRDNNILPSSILSSNSIYGFLPRGNFALPYNGSMGSILRPYAPGLYSIEGNNIGQFAGSAAGSDSSCNTVYSAPYVPNWGSVQGSSVRTNPALYFPALNLTNSQGSGKIVSEELSKSNLPTLCAPALPQVAYSSSNNVWPLFPYVQTFYPFPNSNALIYPGAFFTGLSVPGPQHSSHIAYGETNITDITNSALSGTAPAAGIGGKSTTCNTFYCSPHGQNYTSIADDPLRTNPSVYFSNLNVESAQCSSSQVPPAELGNSDIQNSALSAVKQDGDSLNPGCNNPESESRDCIHDSTKDDSNVPAAMPDSKEGVIPASNMEVPSAHLQEDGDSAAATTTCDSRATSAEAAAEATGVNTAPRIGPRLFPSCYPAKAQSLIMQASLYAERKEEKLKWPLPIPINIKILTRNMSFTNIDYNYVTECVYNASREAAYAQGIDKKGRLRVFVRSPRAASNLLQMEHIAGVAVQCNIAHGYTDTVGYIRSVPRRYSEIALFELLENQGVISAKRQTGYLRCNNGTVSDVCTGTVVLTFLPDRRLPQSVTIDHVSYEVIRRYT